MRAGWSGLRSGWLSQAGSSRLPADRRIEVLVGETLLQVAELPSVHLDVGIDEIVQRLACLRGIELQVPPRRELHAVLVVGAEEVIALVRVLGCLGRVHRHPAVPLQIELRPAVVASDLALAALRGD